MKKIIKEAKTKEEALHKILEELNLTESEILFNFKEEKRGLLKGSVISITAVSLTEVKEEIKRFLTDLLSKMGLEVSFEAKIRENTIILNMNSNQNAILIGKNGQTLKALENITKQIIFNEIEVYPKISLDVENYKEKQINRLERLAKNIAREVKETKIEVKLENMSSYERRIIHNILSENKYVYTESLGEEPNRHVVIKPKN